MRVAVAQLDPKLAEKERNLDACLARLDEAVADGAELVVFPECAIPGYMFESADEAMPYAEEIPGPSTEALADAAARTGAHVCCGLIERDGDRLHNAAVLIGPGGLVGTYRKTHLPFLGVDRFVVPGDELPVWDTPLGRIGVEICYDLRFPEVTRQLVDAGADLVLVPSEWVRGPLKEAHWRTLATARAIENTVYLAAADHAPPIGVGNSLIVDPMGVELAGLGEEVGTAIAWITPARVTEVRRINPALQLRRFTVVPR